MSTPPPRAGNISPWPEWFIPGVSDSPWPTWDEPGPDVIEAYQDVIVALRQATDDITAARPPVEVLREVEANLARVAELMAAWRTDENRQLAGRLVDHPGYGSTLVPPIEYTEQRDRGCRGVVTFGRRHLGGGNAAHGGMHALVFDQIFGQQVALATQMLTRTAYLHVDYRSVTPLDEPLTFSVEIERIEGKKAFAVGQLFEGDRLLCDASALFITFAMPTPG